MNIKNIFKVKKNVEIESSSVKQNEIDLDVPKVIIKDRELQKSIRDWLGISSSFEFGEIEQRFGVVLKLAGIDTTETCILNQSDRGNLSVNCHFKNSGNDAKILLECANIDVEAEFIIDYQNVCKTYVYWQETLNKPTRLNLKNYTIKNTWNGNSIFRDLSKYSDSFTLQNGEYSFSISVGGLNWIRTTDFDDANKIDNAEELQQYLLGLSFPFDIIDVFMRICEITRESITKFSSFKLVVEKKLDKNNEKITDMISKNQEQLKFIITKDGKTVSFDGLENEGNWSYDSSSVLVSKKCVHYFLDSFSNEEFLKANPNEQYNVAKKEVEQVRKLVKNKLNNNLK